jgi:integrase
MRKAEILGLEWDRIHLSTARIMLDSTKSKNHADALTVLEPDGASPRGFLFKKRDDRRWGQIRTAWEGAVKKAGLVDLRFHDLRHTGASHMVVRGASLQDVKEILGHSDLKMTMRYAHLSPAHLRTAVERLDGLTSGAAATESDVETGPWCAHNAKLDVE